jgi:hypothetical protein
MARKKEADSEAESEADTDAVPVEIVVDHVFLPLDEAGNVPETWREAPDTVRVGKGTRLSVPADMLELLADKVARVA